MAVVAVGLLRIGHVVVDLPSTGSPLLAISSSLIATSMLVAILQDTDSQMSGPDHQRSHDVLHRVRDLLDPSTGVAATLT